MPTNAESDFDDMYAVIALGGKQYRVNPGETITVDRLGHEEGATFAPVVVFAVDGERIVHDEQGLAAVKVAARVKGHTLGKKIDVFRYRSKKSSAKRKGHRSRLTVVEIESITV